LSSKLFIECLFFFLLLEHDKRQTITTKKKNEKIYKEDLINSRCRIIHLDSLIIHTTRKREKERKIKMMPDKYTVFFMMNNIMYLSFDDNIMPM